MLRRIAFAVYLPALLACSKPAATDKPAITDKPATTDKPASTDKPAANGLAGWELPTGWRSEVIPFPLDFAPTLAHRGFEELRFPPGFFDPASGEYWSYAFVWRTDDAATLDAAGVGDELTRYFRGLIAAVDDKGRITAPDEIVARATAAGEGRYTVTAHVFDAFKTAQPVHLVGWAERRVCSTGALWAFVLAPEQTSIRTQLDALARAAGC